MRLLILTVCFFTSSLGLAKGFVPTSFSANFEESFVSVATGKEKKTSGKIDYKYPGNIRYEKTSPDPSTFISNPEKSWYYVPPFVSGEEGQVTVQKSNKLPITKFLDSLMTGLEDSKIFKPTYKGHDLILAFEKSLQKEMTLKEVHLHATKDAKSVQKLSEFEKLTLVYTDGRKVNLKFIDLKEGVNFPAGHFNFTVPAKTKVSTN
ncbi:MAG TPA: outer membrane lipoprotein carrier protein LolA [Bacteriovoracaceae bacterium]|nr:outer membrane lipoprotein carrier protein LolA [Bacteriovoracaceae bacterium]